MQRDAIGLPQEDDYGMQPDTNRGPGRTRGRAVDGRLTGRLKREHETMRHMVGLYCKAHHASDGSRPCPRCSEFLDYAERRLGKCPYGQDKPTCANCPVHCYKAAPREFAREIMVYAGPRMLTRHPYLAIRHLLDGRRTVRHPMEMRRQR
jgi:hypothetical protein